MPRITLLTEEERHQYEHPPILTLEEKTLYFSITQPLEKKIKHLHTTTNKVCFMLQYGYFTARKRFFSVNTFRQDDIIYVAKLLGVQVEAINLNKYKTNMSNVHKKSILKMQHYTLLESKDLTWFIQEVNRRVERLTNPRQIFFELIQLLSDHHLALPSYHMLSELISQKYNEYETRLINIIKLALQNDLKCRLRDLLNANFSSSTAMLNQLKNITQSTKPKAIRASIDIFNQLGDLFKQLYPVIQQLNLTPQSVTYYATWVKKSKLSQLKQFIDSHKTYLRLIAFIQHQYYCRQDTFVDIFLKSVQTAKNTAKIRLQASDQFTRNERRAAVKHLTSKNQSYRHLVTAIKEVTKSPHLTASSKVETITELIEQHEIEQNEVSQEKLESFEKSLDDMVKDTDYFNILEKLSVKLQNKVSSILKVLEFNELNSNTLLLKAINDFKMRDGNINQTATTDFLCKREKEALISDNGKFRVSLYKILLFIYIGECIKSGELNLKYSYRYLSINDYLFDENIWRKDREQLLKLSGLSEFSDYHKTISELKQRLNEKYHAVNDRFDGHRNPYLSIDDVGQPHVKTPSLGDKESEHITAFLSQVNYIPILDVLSDVNNIARFTECFSHYGIKNVTQQPKNDVIFAGMIGLGCNIGIAKMAQISTGINQHTLRNTVTWYFALKNIIAANQRIIDVINKLLLPNLFILNKHNQHGASDGRKVNVAIDCLLANKSFKYFGKDSGVSIYTFIDERQVLFHSTVISASEREAAYVIDGINKHDIIKIDIHSTDSHGYTESIFAATHLMGVSFAPRLKNIGRQRLYGFTSPRIEKKKGYQIVPSRTINQKLIESHWEDLLRFMVTVKLKEVSASQLFKRLSSYAKNHPLYKAMKEFGRIIKSLFILTYYDDVILRQQIEKQLSRIELSNKFGRAVFYANNSEFKQASPEEQQTATACTVFIQNAIVLWNYLYLSQLIINCKNRKERLNIMDMIKEGSVITWAHVNLHGEFDFRRHAANQAFFNVDKILQLSGEYLKLKDYI